MPEDASLDDFLDTGSEREATETEDESEPTGEDEEDAEQPEPTGEEPPAEQEPTAEAARAVTDPGHSTFDWSPEGAACAACGSVVERRWRDDSGMVCADCKEW